MRSLLLSLCERNSERARAGPPGGPARGGFDSPAAATGLYGSSGGKSSCLGAAAPALARVYAVGRTDIGPEGRCLAAVLACAPNALLATGRRRGYGGSTATGPERSTSRPRPGATASRRSGSLRRRPPRQRAGSARRDPDLTSVARLLLDLAATLTDPRLERTEEQGLFDLGEIEATLARAGKHHGVAHLRRGLAIYRPDPTFTRSRMSAASWRSSASQACRARRPTST